MTLTLAIALNVAFDIAILGLLAFVMTRAGRLTPHIATVTADRHAPARQPAPTRARSQQPQRGRSPREALAARA